MTQIAQSHQLYLYQLFASTLGIGKQVRFEQIEEVLSEDGLAPADLNCDDIGELLASLETFMRVTVFKRGRVVAAVMRNDVFDEALAKAAASQPKAAPKGKPWKAKGSKELRPEKPKPKPAAVRTVTTNDDPEPQAMEDGPATEPSRISDDEAREKTARDTNADATAPESPSAPPDQPVDAKDVASSLGHDGADKTETPGQDEPVSVSEEAHEPEVAPQQVERELAPSPITAHRTQDVEEGIAPEDLPNGPSDSRDDRVPESAQDTHAQSRTAWVDVSAPPRSISADVYCPSSVLLKLYQALPLGSDYLALLDDAWMAARESVRADRNGRVEFPLVTSEMAGRGTITVAIKRRAPLPSGKRWQLVEIGEGAEAPAPAEGKAVS